MSDPTSTISNEVLLAIFAAIQVLCVAVSKVIDYFVDKGKTDPIEAKLDALLTSDKERAAMLRDMMFRKAEDSRIVAELYAMHKVTDDEGRPAWYFPKKMLEMGDKQMELLREITMAQKDTVHEIKSIVKQLACLRNKDED